MSEGFTLGAYWGSREEIPVECNARLSDFLFKISQIDEVFKTWYRTGWSKKEALTKPVDYLDSDELFKTWNKAKKVSLKFSHSTSLWNGMDGEQSAGITIACGGSFPNSSLCNSISLTVPNVVTRRPGMPIALISAAARAWQPHWAALWSRAFEDRYFSSENVVRKIRVDWALYLSDRGNVSLSDLKSPVSYENLDDGVVIVTQPTPVDLDRNEDVEHVEMVERSIRRYQGFV